MVQVQVSHIEKSFGHVKAVQDVSFEVEKGEAIDFQIVQRGDYRI